MEFELLPSRFEEDQPVEIPADGLTTKAEADAITKQADAMGLGGGVAKVTIERTMVPLAGDNLPRELVFANGMRVNAGVLQESLRKATDGQRMLLQAQYSGIGLSGPVGVSFASTETEYYKAREVAKAAGFVVQGGGVIGEGNGDTEAIGLALEDFKLSQPGNKPENHVVVFDPVNGSERPVCNAKFILYIHSVGGAKALGNFIASRAVPKGWRASAGFGGFVTGFGGGVAGDATLGAKLFSGELNIGGK